MTHFMYAIGPRDRGFEIVKIGVSSDVTRRISSIQTGSPLLLEVYSVWEFDNKENAYRCETAAHDKLRRYKSHGEWFNLRLKTIESFMSRYYDANDTGWGYHGRRSISGKSLVDIESQDGQSPKPTRRFYRAITGIRPISPMSPVVRQMLVHRQEVSSTSQPSP